MMTGEACTMGFGMMVGMGLISLLLIVVLVLGVAALAKYLFSSKKVDRASVQEPTSDDDERHLTK